ncbi:hypothetical protein GJ744_000068 [Endocarpon pusillum]|uniref:Thioredoxin domain-containing protein n=1 Tax=Endocarpon pusillum TaxID=364733 RepID=A0A8H7AS13_9EURO|nr:hypothetical protein GJ744_000068 [Endocarpon pusillum]
MSHMPAPDHQKPKQDHSVSKLSSHPPTTTAPATRIPDTSPSPSEATSEEDAENILTALETDDDPTSYPAHLRESRAQALASELQHARRYHHAAAAAAAASNHPEGKPLLAALTGDESVLKFTTQHPTCLVHFSHPDFARCRVMDRHLTRLVPRHAEETRFATVDVRDAPFVVERLGVRVLPCLVGFRDGVAVGRIVGFEGVFLGGGGQGGRGGCYQGD